ncbi:MAG: zf-HC2 domain-containing protein [Dethiobacter sp.]
MNCKIANKLFSAKLSGELDVKRAALLQHHLDECRDCEDLLNQLQTVLAVLRESQVSVAVPDGFTARVMDRLQAESQRASLHTHSLFRKLAFAASFIFLLGMNGLLLDRYQSGQNQAALDPQTVPAGEQTVESVEPSLLPGQAEGMEVTAPHNQAGVPAEQASLQQASDGLSAAPSPAEQASRQQASDGLSMTPSPAEQQPVPVAATSRVTAAQGLTPRPPAPRGQLVSVKTPQPASAEQPMVNASLSPVIIPDPEVFIPKRRVTEGSLLKIAVTDLPRASRLLAEAAAMRGLAPTVASVVLAADGRLVMLYRYEVPWFQANRFINDALHLGLVLDERHLTEDISVEYEQKLEQYRQLAARVHLAEGAKAAALQGKRDALLMELSRMHSAASDAQGCDSLA